MPSKGGRGDSFVGESFDFLYKVLPPRSITAHDGGRVTSVTLASLFSPSGIPSPIPGMCFVHTQVQLERQRKRKQTKL